MSTRFDVTPAGIENKTLKQIEQITMQYFLTAYPNGAVGPMPNNSMFQRRLRQVTDRIRNYLLLFHKKPLTLVYYAKYVILKNYRLFKRSDLHPSYEKASIIKPKFMRDNLQWKDVTFKPRS